MCKWIIDTDIGDDIDDAFAIRYSVYKNMDISAITTVHRCPYMRAELAKFFLLQNGLDIPVYAGEESSLKVDWQKIYSAKNYFEIEPENSQTGKWLAHYTQKASGTKIEKENAVDFIINCALKNQKNISILALAPLTNIATAIKKEPKIIKAINEIVVLGGNINSGKAEWNIRLDPEAAKVVFKSRIPIKLITTDFSWKHCVINIGDIESSLKAGKDYQKVLSDMLSAWKKQPIYKNANPCLHDVLAVVAAVSNDVVKFEKKKIKLSLRGKKRAITRFSNSGYEISVSCFVDENKFKQEVLSSLL